MEDLINELNQQYEEVDSKQEVKEEKVDLDEILKANELTEKWLDEAREYKENSKDDNYSKEAFTRKASSTYSKRDDEKKKEEPRKSSYSYYRSSSEDDSKSSSYSRYSAYSSSSSSKSSSKSSDEAFYDKVEKAFNDKIIDMVDELMDKHLNRIEEGHDWDILDLQYELNKKRVNDRDYTDEPISIEFKKSIEKRSNACSRKIDIAEILVVLKVNPFS